MRLSLYEFRTGAETVGGQRVVYDVANDTAHFGAADGRRARARLAARRHGGGRRRRAPLAPDPGRPLRRLGAPLRPRRLPAGRRRVHAHASRAGHPLPAPRPLDVHTEGHTASYGPGGGLVRGRAGSRARRGVAAPADRVRPRPDPAGRVGRKAHDSLRECCRRGPAEAPEADRVPRARAPPPSREDGRQAPRRPARRARRRPRVRRPRRELPRGARCPPRRAAPVRHLPARGRGGEHGRRLREAHGPPGHLHGHAGPGRDACRRRDPHRLSGLDAADPPDRPGEPRR